MSLKQAPNLGYEPSADDLSEPRHIGCIKDYPRFQGEWISTPTSVLENPPYGSIRHRVVIGSDGTPLYDFPHIIEPGGAALLPYTSDGRVGLIHIHRPALLKPLPEGSYPEYLVPADFGRMVWEAPRGYQNPGEEVSATAFREFFEETGLNAADLETVGTTAPNSALFATPIHLYLSRVDLDATPITERDEGVTRFQLFDLQQVRALVAAGELICAITHSLLFAAIVRGRLK